MRAISDQESLATFVYNNPNLERLEALLDDFNPFVALRWTRQELRHSSFLAWILDPSETHGLGDYFLRTFLKQAVYDFDFDELAGPSVFDLDTWDLSASGRPPLFVPV